MGISVAERSRLGQTSLEYLLLLAVVAVIVIASFSPGSLISQVHDSAQSYYNSVSSVIMDSDGINSSGQDIDNPKPINGGWCPVTCPAAGNGPATIFGSCECPFPAFGGAPCSGISPPVTGSCNAGQTCPGAFEISCSGVSSCSCPTGQTCNSSGQCVCGNGLVCCPANNPPPGCSGPSGSVANTSCTQCICPSGTQYQGPAPGACVSLCPQVCTVWNGTGCVPETCPGNQYCDTTPGPGYGQCQCIFGTYWNGVLCVPYCTAFCQTWNGTSCAPTVCSLPNMYCNPSDGQCECESPYTCWNGSACVVPPCTCTGPTCTCAGPTCSGTCCAAGDECNAGTGACCLPSPGCGTNTCGTDSCGNTCGTCPPGSTCSGGPDNPGTCNNNTCTPTNCVVSAPCGTDLGIDNCGGVCVGVANQCPLDAEGKLGTCDNGQCICGICNPAYPCGSTVGFDDCGEPCTATPLTCPTGLVCNSNFQCDCGPNSPCYASYPCGSSAGYNYCGEPCNNAPPGTCPTGYICNSSDECACNPVGPCEPNYQCGSTSGWDANCDTPCNDAIEGTCPTGETCSGAPNYTCSACVSNGSCTAPCGSYSGVDNCGNFCTTQTQGTTCPVGETCTSGQCVCTTPGICPTGAVCGPDTCGNANGCNGPNACPNGEICSSSGQCVANCLACQTWNGSSCVTTSPCGSNQCGTDGCGNECGPMNGGCPTGDSCSSGQCCPTCESWNGSACAITTPCGSNQCGTDSCGTECGPLNGGCPTGETCSSGQCVCTPDCTGAACGAPDGCGGTCQTGTCPPNETCASGQCVDCPNCAGAVCGGPDGCGGICQTGSCSGGGSCNAGQCDTTFTLLVSNYLNCSSCAAVCSFFNLLGSCGSESDCGGQPGCPIVEGSCTPDPSGEGSDCGTCVSEAVTSINGVSGSGVPCPDGIATLISQVTSSQTYGTCGENPTLGEATVTYTVICNP